MPKMLPVLVIRVTVFWNCSQNPYHRDSFEISLL